MSKEYWTALTLAGLGANERNAIVGGPFGSNLVSSDYTEVGVPVIRGQNMGEGRWLSREFAFVSEEKADLLRANLARPGDIVFTQRGTIGQVAIVPDAPWDRYVISQSQMKATIDRAVADPLFIYYYFCNPAAKKYIAANAIQTGVPHTNLGQLRAHPMRIPSLAEQHAIASVLGSLDDRIEQNRRTAEALERLARAIFRAWFVDFEPVKAKAAGATAFPSMPQPVFDALPTRFVDSDIRPVPEGWEVKALSSICTLVGGGTPKRSEAAYWDGDVPWYSVKDAPGDGELWVITTSERITADGLADSAARVVPKGCTIISARGTVGKLAMAGAPMAFNQSCYGLLPGDEKSFGYLHLLMQSVVAELQQRTHGSVFDTITRATFDGLHVISPPADVVSTFESVVDPLLALLLASVDESLKLAEMRDYLLPKLLNGDVQVEALCALTDDALNHRAPRPVSAWEGPGLDCGWPGRARGTIPGSFPDTTWPRL